MGTTITYLFDPLCGWCYGASPAVQRLAKQTHIRLELAPTGLFAGGGRVMDAAFADFAWSNDLRIQKLTGQPFSEEYRTQVLGQRGSRFDSSASTLALTAVAITAPEHELATLKALQEARYVQGLNTSAMAVVEKLLRGIGQDAAADLMVAGNPTLLAANNARLRKAQTLMRELGAQGVPTALVSDDKGVRLLPGNLLYGAFDNLLTHIAAA
ncbi:DsbA family protein [Rhodoferax sp. GW822-FHT02A01]|uniref:DsbA family protein n=1 Tax=Rhodoferax sp. GW822-FHT02A01 TaxID=3141537 RepID=UPI00315D6F04